MKVLLVILQGLIIAVAVALGITAMFQCGRELWAVGLSIHILIALGAAMLCCVLSYMEKGLQERTERREVDDGEV